MRLTNVKTENEHYVKLDEIDYRYNESTGDITGIIDNMDTKNTHKYVMGIERALFGRGKLF